MNDGATTQVAPSFRPWRRWAVAAVLLLVVIGLVRAFAFEDFHVPSASMEPGLRPGDAIVVAKWRTPHRGDIIVFNGSEVFDGQAPPSGLTGAMQTLGQAVGIRIWETDYVKRVIGVGGDRVSVGADGTLRVNGVVVHEPYLPHGTTASAEPFSVVVPAGHLFVLGDNRNDSDDSRDHLGDPGGGMVPVSDVIGVVVWRYWPLSRIGAVG